MGCTRKRAVLVRKGAQYTLPSIDLTEEQTPGIPSTSSILSTSSISSSSTQTRSNTLIAKNAVIENRLDGFDDNDNDFCDLNHSSDNENPIDYISENEETKNENANLQKRIQLAATITSMHDMQLQMFATIQEMQTKINELHASLKTSSRNNTEKETKWIEDAIGEVIYDAIEKTKYLADEHLMKICYDMLSDIKKVEFQNNVVGNAILTKMSVQLSNIVQRIKDTIHSEFSDLIKPKTGNRQVTHEEERKFKDSDITKECYSKLNQPVDANDDPHYTYFNLIIDRTFADLNTEKNSIAFGIAIALNYLDPPKGISMVPSE
ncbi:7669_t:CDS:2, partial [Gigaspora rosea]